MFGITQLDIEIVYHFKKHGKFIDGEILAQCPLCRFHEKKADHRVIYFKCKCGDDFFCHLNNMNENYELFPTGKIDISKANWSKMFE